MTDERLREIWDTFPMDKFTGEGVLKCLRLIASEAKAEALKELKREKAK